MKTFITGLLKGRITRWGFLAALLIAVGASVGWMDQRHYQLGGGWIGNSNDGLVWNCLQIPLDPAGKTGAIRVSAVRWSDTYAGLIAMSGANTVSDGVGEVKMISKNTAKWTFMVYEQYAVPGASPVIKAIEVYSGTWKFTGPDTVELNYQLDIYPPEADLHGDGFPVAGATPFTIPGLKSTGKRVPIL
jgi:hypothetical protein